MDLETYVATLMKPRDRLALIQIFELYHDGYITKKKARELAREHAGDLNARVAWPSVNRKDSG